MKIRTPAAAIAAISMGIAAPPGASAAVLHDIVLQAGTIYDGTGGKPYVGDVAIDGNRITYVGPHKPMRAKRVINVSGKAVAPGFINVLSHAEETLLADGRAESDLYQGVTLEIMGEDDSMGPTTDAMAKRDEARESDIKYPIDWRRFEEYFEKLEKRGVSVNVASFVGAGTVRDYVLGEGDVQPTPTQLARMRDVAHQAMQEGALGVGSALIYAPSTYAQTPELTALATEAGRCGGIYITHMRSESDHILEALGEAITIAKDSGAPAEIFHLKQAGKSNWSKLDPVIARIEAARATGVRLTADMYTSTAAATGFDASMPHWVLDGGLEAWVARMKDPAIRARLLQEMRDPPAGYESALAGAGAEGTLLLAFKNDALKPLTGKTLAEVARMRGKSPEETVIDLVIEDNSRIGVAYILMSEDNVRKEATLPWMSFGSDEGAPAPEGVFLESNPHPRAYDNFAKLLAEFVRKDKAVTLPDAIHRLSALPAANLSLKDRGLLRTGYFADVVVFDPDTIEDHATFASPHQLASGVEYVLVNGGLALDEGKATGSHTGRFVRGRGWTGWHDGGCRASARSWSWAW